ncbi:MAG: sodium-translocating pyrophosphatase [Candidatus Micrarchaeota archaeon]
MGLLQATTILSMAVGALILIYAGVVVRSILRLPQGGKKAEEVADAIRQGANAYLIRQSKTLAPFVIVLAVLIGLFTGAATGVAFVAGVVCSALAGFFGMLVSVRSNSRTAKAAEEGLAQALGVAVKGGSVTGLALVGLGLLGIGAIYYLTSSVAVLVGFGFGASLISLFARVGGGIYTKAADVGADLVGKIEKGIPEDDPRNPAVIADNVGDNVGDCAGMAADLFESYVVTIIAAMLLGAAMGPQFVTLPLLVGIIGAIASVLGLYAIRLGKSHNIMNALYKGVAATCIIAAVGFSLISFDAYVTAALLVGVVATGLMFKITEYYTSKEFPPVKEVAKAAQTGAGTNLIAGLAVGMQSTALPVLVIIGAIIASFAAASAAGIPGVYGIAIAAVAMLSLTGIVITLDAYGPITDNAGGIAEMSGAPSRVRKITDELDSVGNTTKATTKGFAIAGAALGALALFAAFAEETGLQTINILDPRVTVGLFIGGLLPFLFSSFLMKAVGKAAFDIVEEVRRQFRTNKGIMSGKTKPDYARVVDISTQAALKELLVPGALAVLSPLAVGLLLGPAALGGLLAGAIVSGFLLALFMSTSGAAWDNAKKYVEDGNFGGKGSDTHKAAVVGDTVGDPFKDTAGPSLNALIKVLNTVSLVFAAFIVANALKII